ncbi:GntR family transcriptional regulator [Streptomyces kasugaensis]|uniref:GntR family transcriptional regulator n=1 Tax=Streptomyces kasugaensis TaxID=1946 RepID=A0A4Q9HRC1_STRKA|nr:GntR family transcriptional regulator [Streptomyces kasugaensis]TBO57528.1 GntR family transcriptional regulator [Streptomyces kasugaensis]
MSQRGDDEVASYRDVAARIRRDVEAGLWPAEKPIPGIERLRVRYGVARETAHRAVKHLVAEGLLFSEGRRGTFIRPAAPAPIVARDRHAYRDQLGYFFDLGAQDWRGIGTPTQEVGVPPTDVADLLGVAHGEHVMIRDRAVGPPDAARPLQLATSYLPMSLVGQLPVLGAVKTGPGGIYDRIEEHFDAVIEWEETVSARPARDVEQEQLRIGAGLPVLVVTRVSRVGDQVVEVNQTRMPADRFAVSYAIARDESACWPREARGE